VEDDATVTVEPKCQKVEALEKHLSEAMIEPQNLVAPINSMEDVPKEEILESRRAKMKKLEYFQAFEWITKEDAEQQGLRFIKSRWEDTKKYDSRKAAVRSRWVLQHVNFGKAATPDLYSPTPTLTAVRLVDALAVQRDWKLVTGDVSTAFMHADEEHLIATNPPDGWQRDGFCWKLLKNKSGRRTGAVNWIRFLTQSCKELGLEPLQCEPCVFKNADCSFVMVVHVDDLLVTGEDVDGSLAKLQDRMLLKIDPPIDESGDGCFLGRRKFALGTLVCHILRRSCLTRSSSALAVTRRRRHR
jgi:hypothetical protein